MKHSSGIQKIPMRKEKISQLVEKLEVRQEVGPDKMSGHNLKECRKELSGPITDLKIRLFNTGKCKTGGKELISHQYIKVKTKRNH